MADIDELPEFLKPVAIRIPGETVAMMEQLKLRLRAEWLHELHSRAEGESPDKAERTRRLAERVTRSLSDYAFSAERAELAGRLADAHRRDATGEVYAILAEIRRFEAANPRLPADRVMGHAAGVVAKVAEGKLPPIPPPVKSRLFSRRVKHPGR